MKTLEYNWPYAWANWLCNRWPLLVDTDSVRTLFTRAFDDEGLYRPGDRSLFYNGYIFLRITSSLPWWLLHFPTGFWLHLKWFPDSRFQCGFGWKLNGRFAILLRYQTDSAAAAGVHGPNVGQASAWARGTA